MEIVSKVDYDKFISELKNMSCGEVFIAFQQKIINTKKEIIGVKTPDLRKLAKEINKDNHSGLFEYAGSKYFEEILVQGFVLALERDRTLLVDKLNEFYKRMDNWAVVDMVAGSIEVFKKAKNREEDFRYLASLIEGEEEFTVRFGIVALMKYFIDEEYLSRAFEVLYKVKCDKYYVNMAIAWLISEVLIKNPQNAEKIMQKIIKINHFNSFIINKAIQKACESYRIDINLKNKLKEMKIK